MRGSTTGSGIMGVHRISSTALAEVTPSDCSIVSRSRNAGSHQSALAGCGTRSRASFVDPYLIIERRFASRTSASAAISLGLSTAHIRNSLHDQGRQPCIGMQFRGHLSNSTSRLHRVSELLAHILWRSPRIGVGGLSRKRLSAYLSGMGLNALWFSCALMMTRSRSNRPALRGALRLARSRRSGNTP